MDRRLADKPYLAGDDYSIADIACYSWVYAYERRGFDISDNKNVLRWIEEIGARPAVQKGCDMLQDMRPDGPPSAETLKSYFGDVQYEKR